MKIPEFTAEYAFADSTRFLKAAHQVNTEWLGLSCCAPEGITLAIRDARQQEYKECLIDCRSGGGRNCAQQCSEQTRAHPGYGTVPGTSDAQALCCMGFLAACLAQNYGDAFGMAGCFFKGMSCTKDLPCSAL
jgi:hypothetical protein